MLNELAPPIPRFSLWNEVYYLNKPYKIVSIHASSTADDFDIEYSIASEAPGPSFSGNAAIGVPGRIREQHLLTKEEFIKGEKKRIIAAARALGLDIRE